jgi:nucleotide-binding universal stress UspA family protein
MSGIIVGIDGSGHSRRALEWAISEAATRQVPLTVLTVYRALVGYLGEPVQYVGDAELTEQARKEAQKETDDVLDEFAGSRPPSVTVRAVTGIPAGELLTAAEDADLLVVGARGAGGFKRLLLGSVSTHVTHHAHCPVVVVPAAKA